MAKASRRLVTTQATLQLVLLQLATSSLLSACVDTGSAGRTEQAPLAAAGASAVGATGDAASRTGDTSSVGSGAIEGVAPVGLAPAPGGESGASARGADTGVGLGVSGGAGGGSRAVCNLPASFQWTTAGAPLIVPRSDAAHELVAVKDPTVVRFNDRWHVYASSVSSSGAYGMVYTSFGDMSDVSSASWYYMDQTPGFNTYVAAPQLFYFTPQNTWYLLFQSGPPMYSTAGDPGEPTQWTRPAPFFPAEPAIITQNGGWLDFWVICDAEYCHLFFSDDHGRWYKSKTLVGNFPSGFDTPVIVMQDADAGRLFEASNVYKVAGTNTYLALIEAFDSTSNYQRYFRSWTAESLEGPWSPLADSGAAPFAGKQNVAFDGTAWTDSISHGEMVRAGFDESLSIDACSLQFVFQGFDPAADTGNYNAIPWRLGLLTPAP